jgi:hypothetical protein
MNLLLPFITSLLTGGHQKVSYGKWAATLIALLSFSVGCIFAGSGLYHYLLPQWGKAISLSAIGGGCLVISILFLAVRHFLKPPPSAWRESATHLEKNLSEALKQVVNVKEVLQILRPYLSLKSLGALFVIGVVLAFYLGNSGREPKGRTKGN